MSSNEPRHPKLSSPNSHNPPDDWNVIPIFRKKPKRKYQRTSYPLMPRDKWSRDFDGMYLAKLLFRMRKKRLNIDCGGHKIVGPGMSGTERDIVGALCHHHVNKTAPAAGIKTIMEITSIPRSNISSVLRMLAECRIIVNIGTTKRPNLAPNPLIGMWNLSRLSELRQKWNTDRRG